MEVKEAKECIEFLQQIWSVPIIGKDKLNKEWLYRIIKLIKQGENDRIELADENQML